MMADVAGALEPPEAPDIAIGQGEALAAAAARVLARLS